MTRFSQSLPTTGRALSAITALTFTASCGSFYSAFDDSIVDQTAVPVLQGASVRSNVTPMDSVLECYAERLQRSGQSPVSIAVGEVRDFTGKQGGDEGFVITQGGSLMAYSALGKLLPGISLHERFDTRIADSELNYGANRQLGDGAMHNIDDPATGGSTEVPWLPYFGGSVIRSDYYILGGITEVNYNIQSGGSEFRVNQIGPKLRTYTMNIAVVLRIVETQSLRVIDTVSVEKQITGYEIGFEVFRFFNTNLFDVNIGQKSQEPIQLGVRLAIESAILELTESVTNVAASGCQNTIAAPVVSVDAADAHANARASVASEQS